MRCVSYLPRHFTEGSDDPVSGRVILCSARENNLASIVYDAITRNTLSANALLYERDKYPAIPLSTEVAPPNRGMSRNKKKRADLSGECQC